MEVEWLTQIHASDKWQCWMLNIWAWLRPSSSPLHWKEEQCVFELMNPHNRRLLLSSPRFIACSLQAGRLGRQEGFREWFSGTLCSLELRIAFPINFPSPAINCEGKIIAAWICYDHPIFPICSWPEFEIKFESLVAKVAVVSWGYMLRTHINSSVF